MNTSYPVRSGTDCSYGFSPAAMRRAMVVTLASSIALYFVKSVFRV